MKLKTLKARGFWGFRRGLGVDEITVDLSSLSGLVAITGDNGKGKTTLLELLTPYRQLASRNGNIKGHVFLRDSFKELTFDFNGAEYRTLIKIDCDSDRSEGFIFKDGVSLVNGKLRDYDKKINELFGSPELFFSSVFCAQNAAKLSDLTVGQIKGLFSEFLQLDKLEAYEATAKRAGAIVAGLVAGKGREIEKLQGQDVARLETDLHNNTESIAEGQEAVRFTEKTIVKSETALETARAAAASNAVIMERAAGVRNELKALEKQRDDDHDKSNRELSDLRTKCTAAIQEQQRAETLAAKAGEIDEAELKAGDCRGSITAHEMKKVENENILAVAQSELDEIAKIEAPELARIHAASHDTKLAELAAEIKNCRESMAILEKRSPNCNDLNCALIAHAVESAERLPKLEKAEADITKINAAIIEDAEAIISECRTRRAAAAQHKADAENRIASARADIKTEQARLAVHEKILSQRSDIAAAVERKAGIETRIQELRAEGMSKKAALEIRQKNDAENVIRLEQLIKDIEAEVNYGAESVIVNCENTLFALKKEKSDTEKALATLQAQREQISARLAEARAAEKKVEALKADAQALQIEAAEWQYIQAACGNNGLRALEIDGVAPCITNNANTLLAATYGPAFSVSIRTVDPETGKETFDVVVTTDDGTETLLENLSGGQKVWILKALRLAMTLISKDKSALNYKTAFSDEEDGALDVCNAENFVNMYRAFMNAGGFESLLYISHRPECVAMADSQINFSAAGITINWA